MPETISKQEIIEKLKALKRYGPKVYHTDMYTFSMKFHQMEVGGDYIKSSDIDNLISDLEKSRSTWKRQRQNS